MKLGRRLKLTLYQQREAIRRRESVEESLAEIKQSYNVSGWTIARLTDATMAPSHGTKGDA